MIFVLAKHKLKSEAPTLYLNKSSGIEDINVPSKADLNVLAFVQWSNKPTGIDEIRVFLNIPMIKKGWVFSLFRKIKVI